MMLVILSPTPHWHRLDGTREIAAGDGWPQPDPATPLVLAVPGEAVALHWIDLPALAPAQAAAAARIALADQMGEADPHIAVALGAGLRPVAVTARTAMASWLAQIARAGWKANAIVPDVLLLPVPVAGWAVAYDGPTGGNRVLARSAAAAFAGETDIAAAIIGPAPTIAARLALPDLLPINLLCGEYAPVARWRPAPGQVRRLALLASAIAGLWIAGDVANLLRARSAADTADTQTRALARPYLDGETEDAELALAGLKAAAQARGAAGGVAALAGPVVQALARRPGSGLAALAYTPGGGLVAGVAGGAGEAQALADALAQDGLAAMIGTTRAGTDGSISDVTVRAR